MTAGPVEHYIFPEELAAARAPELVGRIGVNLVGPTLLAHGHARAAGALSAQDPRAEEIWCQLFSEPDAGSDLDALHHTGDAGGGWLRERAEGVDQLRAVRRLGGCLRAPIPTHPRTGGLLLVVDMRDPGVEVRPLRQITDETDFNEVFFSDVFVPEDRIIGAENEGWQVANQTLTHERGVDPRQLVIHTQLVEELLRLATENDAFDDHRNAQRLAEAFVEVQIFRLHNWRSISRTAKGEAPGPVGSINKIWWSEMSKRLHDTAMTVLGPASPLWRGADQNPGDGQWQRSWLYYQASSIWAGTNEIQRNLIGERTLGLPREPQPSPRTK